VRGEGKAGAGASASSDLTPELLSELTAVDSEPLRRPDVGLRLIRGGTIRVAGYGLSMLLTAAASVLLLRHLGVSGFGRYMTVASLIAIVSGVTDIGLAGVGARDLGLRPQGEERRRLLSNLLGIRLVLTPLGVLAATSFAVVADYDRTLVLGTILAGAGLVVTSFQGTMTLPLSVELRIGRLTVTEALRQVAMLLGIALLVAAGAGLLSFFALFIAVGLVALAVTPLLVGRGFVWRPAFDRAEWRTLIRESLPLAVSAVMGVVYFRVLIVLMSLLATEVATGLFATSFRVTEMLYGLSSLVLTVALPVMAVAAEERARLRYMLQRMSEVAAIAACYLVLVVVVAAEPVLDLLGGSQYRDAAPVLQIQVFALIPVFLGQVLQFGLFAVRRQSAQAVASGVALVFVLTLGLILVPMYDATGAAIAALIAETGFAISLLTLLLRYEPMLRPSFWFLWKIALGAGLAASTVYVPGLPTLGTAAVATLVYAVVLWLVGALPRELLDAFVLRNRA
jgi:O-antigen/teichoic acid export membrane protein